MSNLPAHCDPLRSHTSRDASEQSLKSKVKASSGPSQNEPAIICSTWTIGWQTPTLMIACYVLAIVLALVHLILFQFINGRAADGPTPIAPQTYISTASNILANAFGVALRASLGVAFCQYLWHLFRVQTMKVSTIELLFAIRSNPFQIFRMATLRATPTLCALALLMFLSQIATGFPPGAITIEKAPRTSYEMAIVPSFDASFMGNGSGSDANAFSLIKLKLDPTGTGGFESGDFIGGKDTNLINRLARQVLVAGEALTMPSPCGANCSYVVEFEGPYVECTNSSQTAVVVNSDGLQIYTGDWISPASAQLAQSLYNGTYTLAHLNTTTLTPISVNVLKSLPNSTTPTTYVTVQQDNTICSPGRAKYTLNHTYVNNVHSRNVTMEPVDRLIDLALQTHGGIVVVPGFTLNKTFAYGTQPANWSTNALNFYRDNNHMAILDAMMSWLAGSFNASLQYADADSPSTALSNSSYDLAWEESFISFTNGVSMSNGPQGNTVIDSTRFNQVFNQYTNAANPSFNISSDILNDYLLNMTMSIATAYGRWNTSANATVTTLINVYSFSQPLNLLIPYFLTLLLSLPFIILGSIALLNNGVSAMDGSFMQIITTSIGSSVLDKAAAGGCLGGNESMPEELKDLKIRFGEFLGRDDPGGIKRSGFGVEGEVRALQKGAKYGIARWL
ncbi:uncharacterized protein PAC_05176 [Phialocephala subalpina]|uniref:Uncharacterized protein n=1 Tax=Phialocephala subalpina TaxID=576137 RepID=A0A1L7WRA1_9HELO|nr:uncharacterized protein PAC_05176 [Phialocephala subalpina]